MTLLYDKIGLRFIIMLPFLKYSQCPTSHYFTLIFLVLKTEMENLVYPLKIFFTQPTTGNLAVGIKKYHINKSVTFIYRS